MLNKYYPEIAKTSIAIVVGVSVPTHLPNHATTEKNTMKRSILALCMLLTLGCAHVRLQSWSGNTYKFCGSKWADSDDFDSAARKSCPGRVVSPVAGGIEETGDVTVRQQTMFESASIRADRRNCVIYECK